MQTSEGVNAAALKAIARCNTFEKTVSMMLSRSDTLNNTHGMLLSADEYVALGFADCLLTWLHPPTVAWRASWNAANDAKRQRATV